MNDNDPSILRNMHEDLPPPEPPKPLEGEVKALANDPSQEDTVSVLANKPETLAPPPPPAPLGEVMAGASNDKDTPPSLFGTFYAPKARDEQPIAVDEETQTQPTARSTHRRR